MRAQVVILATAASGIALAQGIPTGTLFESLASAGSEVITTVGSGIDALDPTARELLAPVLTAWITGTRDAAIERGVKKIPSEIREALHDFVSREIIDDVRWRVEEDGWSVEQSLLSAGYTSAVTLDNVVLFASSDDVSDPKLWAHEIFHVMQYREWGVDEFVRRYLENRAAVEHEAWEFRWQWMKATDRVPKPQ